MQMLTEHFFCGGLEAYGRLGCLLSLPQQHKGEVTPGSPSHKPGAGVHALEETKDPGLEKL